MSWKNLIILLLLISLGVYWMLPKIISWQDTPLVDFATLTLPDKENYALVYKHQQLPRLIKSPIFATSAENLQQAWKKIATQQPRLHLLKTNNKHFQYVQYSRVLHFPDLIDVKIVPLSDNSSTIYLYSRSVYGYSDFNVNPKRVEHWLKLLKQEVNR